MNAMSTFEADYRAYYSMVAWALRQFPGLEAQRDDLVQDVFLSYWQNRDAIAPEKKKAWLIVTARHKAIDVLRKNRRQQTESRDFQTSDPLVTLWISDPEHETRVAALSKMLDDLPAQASSQSFVQHYRGGLSFKTIAAAAGQPIGTIAAQIARSRKKFAQTFRAQLAQS